ncbi:MAG: hypothetical protein Q9224_004325 [Gallowayella concinna]
MRSTITFGALLFLLSTVSALPLLPRIASKSSSSVVERQWNPLSLLARSPSPQIISDQGRFQGKKNEHLKGLRAKATENNPVVKSIWEFSHSTPKFLTRRLNRSSFASFVFNKVKPTLPEKSKGEQGLPARAMLKNPVVKSYWGKRQEPSDIPVWYRLPAVRKRQDTSPSATVVTNFTPNGPVVKTTGEKPGEITTASTGTKDDFFTNVKDPWNINRGWRAQSKNWAVVNGYGK